MDVAKIMLFLCTNFIVINNVIIYFYINTFVYIISNKRDIKCKTNINKQGNKQSFITVSNWLCHYHT